MWAAARRPDGPRVGSRHARPACPGNAGGLGPPPPDVPRELGALARAAQGRAPNRRHPRGPRPRLQQAQPAELPVSHLPIWPYLRPSTSYVSVVELGMYEMTAQIHGRMG